MRQFDLFSAADDDDDDEDEPLPPGPPSLLPRPEPGEDPVAYSLRADAAVQKWAEANGVKHGA